MRLYCRRRRLPHHLYARCWRSCCVAGVVCDLHAYMLFSHWRSIQIDHGSLEPMISLKRGGTTKTKRMLVG